MSRSLVHLTSDPRAQVAASSYLVADQPTDGVVVRSSGGAVGINSLVEDAAITVGGSTATNVILASTVVVGNGLTTTGTVDTTGGAQTITADELIRGYTYTAAAGGAVALTLPGADAVQAELATRNITSAAGMRLPPIIIDVSDANNLTVTAGTGETILGSPVVNNTCAVAHYVFTAAATATCVVCVGA